MGKCKYDDESYKVRGCIGTFTLVPAYFNGARNGHANKNWEKALKILKENDWEIVKYTGQKVNDFNHEDYGKYINTMFLWDFNKHESGSDIIRNCKIKRRSYFMAAMLKIAVEFEDAKIYEADDKKEWADWDKWKVSNVYKYIVKNVFLKKEPYSDYGQVIEKIRKVMENVKIETKDSVSKKAELHSILLCANEGIQRCE